MGIRVGSFEFTLRELAGPMGDFGTLFPLVIGYIAVYGLDPAGFLVMMGIANIATGLISVFPMAIIGAMMLLVGIELTKFARDIRVGRDLIPLAATVAVALLANMAVGFAAGLAVHYGMERFQGR